MVSLLYQGQYALFILILISIIISLTFHEWGHAVTARLFGDPTAQRLGRLTLNPVRHIDPMGLLMVVLVGFGYARPVPTNPANFRSRWASLFVSAAGPLMNLVVAVVAVNLYLYGRSAGWTAFQSEGASFFFTYLALINLLLMVFNLLPIGALDGHYILPYFLPNRLARAYLVWNHRYGNYLLLGLILLSIAGVPVFQSVLGLGRQILPWIVFV